MTAASTDTILAMIRRLQAAEAELAATRRATDRWRQEMGEMQADATLMETLDRIAESVYDADPCRVREAASGCLCATAADEIERLRTRPASTTTAPPGTPAA